jgi:rod shape-determining protein MreD
MRRAAMSAAVVLAAVVLQLTVLDNLRLPLRAAPNLVLVTVVALALTGGPLEGTLAGFGGGLALDVAPPATHLVGQYALVFCLVGYAAGRFAGHLDELAWAPIGMVALGAAAGEALYALTGIVFGDADITWTAARHLLPASVGYDVLLSPFVLYAVTRARLAAVAGLAALRPGASSGPLSISALAAAAGLVAPSGLVVRDSGTGGPPRLKARALRAGPGLGAPGAGRGTAHRPPSRPVQLHLGGGGMPGGSASGQRIPRGLPSRPVHLHLGSRDWASRYRGGLAGTAFGAAGGLLGDGGGGRALRPVRGPRLRGGSMPGGSASAVRITRSRPARPVHLKLASGRRRDGAIGGSVLGRGGRGGQLRRGRSLGRTKSMTGRRAFGTARSQRRARWRGATGRAHTPRFRGVQSRALASRRLTPRRRGLWRMFGKRTGRL